MQLTPRQHRALTAIADTFAPGDGNGVPPASALRVAETVAEFAGRNRRAAERRQLAGLLGLWDSPVFGTLAGASLKRFSSLGQDERERVLLSWADSRVPQRRAAFQALRKAILLLYYAVPSSDGSPSPVWSAIDYPGPLG